MVSLNDLDRVELVGMTSRCSQLDFRMKAFSNCLQQFVIRDRSFIYRIFRLFQRLFIDPFCTSRTVRIVADVRRITHVIVIPLVLQTLPLFLQFMSLVQPSLVRLWIATETRTLICFNFIIFFIFENNWFFELILIIKR